MILPEENVKDLEELPENVREEMCFHHVTRVDEVLTLALLPQPAQKPALLPEPAIVQ